MTTIENRGGVLLAGGSYVASEIKHAQKHVTGYSEDLDDGRLSRQVFGERESEILSRHSTPY